MPKIKCSEIADVLFTLCEKKQFAVAASYLNAVELINSPKARKQVKAGWETLPRGWTEESLRKFWESLTGDVKHKMTKCVEKIKDVPAIDDPYAFCASLKDKMLGTTYWRKGRKPKS